MSFGPIGTLKVHFTHLLAYFHLQDLGGLRGFAWFEALCKIKFAMLLEVLPIPDDYMRLIGSLRDIQDICGCRIEATKPVPGGTEWEVP
eukprot:6480967-Amphidinium_carterae.1